MNSQRFSRPVRCLLLLMVTASLLGIDACNHIETHKTLSKGDIKRIQAMGLLAEDEQIQRFYSEWRKSVSGNFYTDRRMASYWTDDQPERNVRYSAYYTDIISLDTVYKAGLTWCPYLLVTTRDSQRFKVCVEGKRSEIQEFFEGALRRWQAARAQTKP